MSWVHDVSGLYTGKKSFLILDIEGSVKRGENEKRNSRRVDIKLVQKNIYKIFKLLKEKGRVRLFNQFMNYEFLMCFHG